MAGRPHGDADPPAADTNFQGLFNDQLVGALFNDPITPAHDDRGHPGIREYGRIIAH
jgi:hypothetical protein